MYLLFVFVHFYCNVVALFIYYIELMMQLFAQSLWTKRHSEMFWIKVYNSLLHSLGYYLFIWYYELHCVSS